MKTTLERKNKAFHFQAKSAQGLEVNIDGNPEIGGEGKGVRPMELVLMGAGGCASIDLGLILKKQRQELVDYSVVVEGERDDTPAKAFKSVHFSFKLTGNLDEGKVKKAIDLTIDTYCSVIHSLNKDIIITSDFELINH